MRTAVVSSFNFALNTSVSKAAGYYNTRTFIYNICYICRINCFGIYPFNFNISSVFISGMTKCLCNRKISIMKLNIFTDNADSYFSFSCFDSTDHVYPFSEFRFGGINAKLTADNA
ncbi:hypothetical protein SDC9_175492 [bioreactor metagenome]|uniref:Uncharacterized protein n=1 Tax=bioreactor metagenome TaxID=1076179 RepID=A0A645GWL9_9ZZZZ